MEVYQSASVMLGVSNWTTVAMTFSIYVQSATLFHQVCKHKKILIHTRCTMWACLILPTQTAWIHVGVSDPTHSESMDTCGRV